MVKICFATHNRNKLSEIQKLAPAQIQLVSLSDLELHEEIPETGSTLEENSAIKAQYVFDKLGMPCFADDTGLEVEALNGAPGVYSARYAGEQKNDRDNIALLLKNLDGNDNRKAAFKTVITYINSDGEKQQFTGEAKGVIITELKGNCGFGYDPIFVPENQSLTFAEMSAQEKNAISHRGRAFDKFISYLSSL
ncbi:RdgB/HAM1 family non-canonical purine NTP pyrophosphatase [Marinoscillum sp. MHG1-6]|uniref:RdgB/HAM1 family non-canonical purine NTP pyrophosphatase n=1 Tax=Marinoscillum sp. MHG1-6 TaxID=2959627 RepID=UPI00280B668F|nr:RdgB/HAM1 family non-canonical purine NTP pyrophosphatase [Marinoscillum sp. MHG1-6]